MTSRLVARRADHSTNEEREPIGKIYVLKLKDGIKKNFEGIGAKLMNWMELAEVSDNWKTLLNAVLNLPVVQVIKLISY